MKDNTFKYSLIGGMFLMIIVFASVMYSKTNVGDDIELVMADYQQEVKTIADSLLPVAADDSIKLSYISDYTNLVNNVDTEQELGKCNKIVHDNLIEYCYRRLCDNYLQTSENILSLPDSLSFPNLENIIFANSFLQKDGHIYDRALQKSQSYIKEAEWMLKSNAILTEIDVLEELPQVDSIKRYFSIIDSLATDTFLLKKHSRYAGLATYKDTLYFRHVTQMLGYEDGILGDVRDNVKERAIGDLNSFREMLPAYSNLSTPSFVSSNHESAEDSDGEVSQFNPNEFYERIENALQSSSSGFESFSPNSNTLPTMYGDLRLLSESRGDVMMWCFDRNIVYSSDDDQNISYNVGEGAYCKFFFNEYNKLVKISKFSKVYPSRKAAMAVFNEMIKDLEKRYRKNKTNKVSKVTSTTYDLYRLYTPVFSLNLMLGDNQVLEYSAIVNW